MNLVEVLVDRVGGTRKCIVVVGDVMRDVWVYGRAMPSQDGCPKLVHDVTFETPGGAGNARQSLENWAVHAELCGHWNKGAKTRFVADGKIMFRHDHDVIAGVEHDGDRARAVEWVGHADGVLLSDYDKGFLTPDLIHQIAEACRRRGVPCVADVKRAPDIYAGCITKGNEDWYLRYGIASVVTRGGNAPAVSGNVVKMRFPPVDCVNHVGAGDCFAAHLTLALTYGFALEDAAAIAHSAGRVYVQHRMNRAPHPDEVAMDMSAATAT